MKDAKVLRLEAGGRLVFEEHRCEEDDCDLVGTLDVIGRNGHAAIVRLVETEARELIEVLLSAVEP